MVLYYLQKESLSNLLEFHRWIYSWSIVSQCLRSTVIHVCTQSANCLFIFFKKSSLNWKRCRVQCANKRTGSLFSSRTRSKFQQKQITISIHWRSKRLPLISPLHFEPRTPWYQSSYPSQTPKFSRVKSFRFPQLYIEIMSWEANPCVCAFEFDVLCWNFYYCCLRTDLGCLERGVERKISGFYAEIRSVLFLLLLFMYWFAIGWFLHK